MVAYLTRDKWTSTDAGGAVLTGSKLVGVAIHWPGSTTSAYGVETQAKVAERLRGWRNYHVTGRGWSDIGYNFAVDQAGRIWQCRTTDWKGNRVGAHSASATNPDANQERVGVLFILGANEQPTKAMIEAFQHWRWDRFITGWGSKLDLRGHGQVPGASTSCPGSAVRTLISNGTLAKKPTGETVAVENVIKDEAVWESLFQKATNPDERMYAFNYLRYTHKYAIEGRAAALKAEAAAKSNAKELVVVKSELAAIRSALQQLLSGTTAVDMVAVQAASKAGAEEALASIDFDFAVTASPVDEDNPV